MKKNLFNFNLSNSSNTRNGSQVGQITCEPCSLEVEKIKKKINGRQLSEIKSDDIDQVISVFDIKR